MIESKRFKVAVYDENAINGFAVLDLHKPNISKRLKYENVYIGSEEGCEIVCKFGNGLAEENEQLKSDLKSYQNMVKQYINLHIDKIRRRYVNPTKEEVAERTRLTIDLEQLKKELQK